jgi:hypothetical protein
MRSILLFLLFSINTICAQIPSSGLVARWQLDGSALDSLSLNNGYLQMGAPTVNRFGQMAKAIRFNANQLIEVKPIVGILPFSGDFTVSFWARTAQKTRQIALRIGEGTKNIDFSFTEGNNGVFAYWNSGGTNGIDASSFVTNDGGWHNYTLRRINTTVSFVIDNVSRGTSTFSGAIADSAILTIGGVFPYYWNGDMDDVCVWNRGLSDVEIGQIWGGYTPVATKMIAPKLPALKSLKQNTTTAITWDATAITNVKLEFSADSGATWATVANSVAASAGTYNWTVPHGASTKCLIRISDASDPLAFAVSGVFAIHNYVWQELAEQNAGFPEQDGAGGLACDTNLVMIGGWYANIKTPYNTPPYTHNVVMRSDPKTGIFKQVSNGQFFPRHTAVYLNINDTLYIIGGDINSGVYQPDVMRSTDCGTTWTEIASNLSFLYRALHYGFVLNDSIYILCGESGYNTQTQKFDTLRTDVWRSKRGTNWTQISTQVPFTARGAICGTVSFNGRAYIIGGGQYGRYYFNDVLSTTDGIVWQTELKHAPFLGRYYHNIVVFDSKIWVFQGTNGSNLSTAYYSPNGRDWFEMPCPIEARHAACAVVLKDVLYYFSGRWNYDSAIFNKSDFWKLVKSL